MRHLLTVLSMLFLSSTMHKGEVKKTPWFFPARDLDGRDEGPYENRKTKRANRKLRRKGYDV